MQDRGLNSKLGFTLLETMTAVGILMVVMLALYGIANSFGITSQVQHAKIQGNENARRAMMACAPLLRMASRQSMNLGQLPGDIVRFRIPEDADGNGSVVNMVGTLELGSVIQISPDYDDINNDGLTAEQLVLIQNNNARVLANNLFVRPAGTNLTRETSGFWVEPRDNGFEILIRAGGRSRDGRFYSTEMAEFVVPRN